MAKEKKGRVVRESKEISRLFRQIRDNLEDMGINKKAEELSDEIWELGVRTKVYELQNLK